MAIDFGGNLNRAAARAGVGADTYGQFLNAANALTEQYRNYGASRYGGDETLQMYRTLMNAVSQSASGGNGIIDQELLAELQANPAIVEQLQQERAEMRLLNDQYNLEFLKLAQDFGVNTTVTDDDKVYWMSAGDPFSDFGVRGSSSLYGEEAQMEGSGEIGAFYRDSRTDSVSFSDFLQEVVTPQNVLKFALTGGKDAFTWLDMLDVARLGYDSYQDAEQSSFAPQEGGDLQGEVSSTFGDAIEGITGLLESIFAGSDPNAVSIPIPGLPFPIPGSATFEDLLDIAVEVATNTGQAVEGVLDSILSGIEDAGEVVPEPETGDPIDADAPSVDEPVDNPVTGDPNEEPRDIPAFCGLGRPQGQTLGGANAEQQEWDNLCGADYNYDGSLKNEDPGDLNEEPEDEVYVPVCTMPRPGAGTFVDIANGRIWDEACAATHSPDGTPKTPGVEPGDDLNEDDDPMTPGLDPADPGGDLNEDDDPATPGLDPGQSPNDELTDDETETPGLNPALIAGIPGLIGLGLRLDQPERDPLTPGRTLMQANPSRRSDRPDYGDPTPMGLFDFGERISQPTQVGFDPEPRRETITATERERLRRLRRQGLL